MARAECGGGGTVVSVECVWEGNGTLETGEAGLVVAARRGKGGGTLEPRNLTERVDGGGDVDVEDEIGGERERRECLGVDIPCMWLEQSHLSICGARHAGRERVSERK